MKWYTILVGILISTLTYAQENEDVFYLRKIYDEVLTRGECYNWLRVLTQDIGGRLSGSPAAAAAVEYTRQIMDTLEMDSVYLQPCMVRHWHRGEKEIARIVNSSVIGTYEMKTTALGNSVGTGPQGLVGEVLEVQGLHEVETLGEKVKGKIVFYNRPLDPKQISTFHAYGGAVDQRGFGPTIAAKYGAIATIVRSMTTSHDDVPHTGSTRYRDGHEIPAFAISTNDADLLSGLLQKEKVRVYLRNTSKMLGKKKSYNVIGEIKGSQYPEQIILVGGHLDSWDTGEGAHDDGSGCVHALEVIHTLKRMGYQPKRTIRCVMFMNEENGQAGAITYRDESNARGEFHLTAIESDSGGFTPRGFTCDAQDSVFNALFPKIVTWLPLLEPYNLSVSKGGSGADISRLKSQGGLLFGFRVDPQRYFDYHHTPDDTFDKVNERELKLGAAAITSLVYLIDKYGLN